MSDYPPRTPSKPVTERPVVLLVTQDVNDVRGLLIALKPFCDVMLVSSLERIAALRDNAAHWAAVLLCGEAVREELRQMTQVTGSPSDLNDLTVPMLCLGDGVTNEHEGIVFGVRMIPRWRALSEVLLALRPRLRSERPVT